MFFSLPRQGFSGLVTVGIRGRNGAHALSQPCRYSAPTETDHGTLFMTSRGSYTGHCQYFCDLCTRHNSCTCTDVVPGQRQPTHARQRRLQALAYGGTGPFWPWSRQASWMAVAR